MTIRNINPIVNTNTFDQWKSRTNEIIIALGDVVTLGGPTANNNAELYIDGDISTSTKIVTDEIIPLSQSFNTISMRSLIQMNDAEFYVPTGGKANAIQFKYGELTTDRSWSIGPVSSGAIHNGLRITGYYPGEIGITPITSYLEIFYADERNANNAVIPGIITAENLVIDDGILPEEMRFSNAASATTWKTPRLIYFSDDFNDNANNQPAVPIGERGDVLGQMYIDGSGDVICYLKVRNDSHFHDERYFTKEEITNEYDTVTTNDTRYVRVNPDVNPNADGYLVSSILRGGVRFNNSVPILWGNLDSASTRWDNNSSSLVTRQIAGDFVVSTGGRVIIRKAAAAGDTTKFNFNTTDGNLVVSGDVTAFGSPSDRRLKENIEVIPNGLLKVSQLNGYTFNYKSTPDKKITGLMADELEKVLPEAIYEYDNSDNGETDDKDTPYKAIRYGTVVGLLVEAIKELKAEVDALKARVN